MDTAGTEGAQPPVRVLVVDDHPTVRFALRAILSQAPGLEVAGEEETLAAAVMRVRRDEPDVVVLDLGLPDAAGARGIRLLRSARAEQKVVVFSGSDDPAMIEECRAAGASGYVPKSAPLSVVAETVAAIARGEQVVEAPGAARHEPSRADRVTKRELEVLAGVSQGLTNRQIAGRLGVSEETVKTHLSRAMSKLGAADRAQAVAMMLRHGSLQ